MKLCIIELKSKCYTCCFYVVWTDPFFTRVERYTGSVDVGSQKASVNGVPRCPCSVQPGCVSPAYSTARRPALLVLVAASPPMYSAVWHRSQSTSHRTIIHFATCMRQRGCCRHKIITFANLILIDTAACACVRDTICYPREEVVHHSLVPTSYIGRTCLSLSCGYSISTLSFP